MLSLVLGGGTDQGLWTDHLLEVFMVPALFLGLGGLPATRLATGARVLVILILALVLLQFLPIARSLPIGREMAGVSSMFFSPAPQRSLEAALFALSVLGFSLLIARFSDADQERLLRFLFVGFFINLVVGIIQLSYGQRVAVSDVLPFTIRSGLFANENHLSSLIYVMIPLGAYLMLVRARQLFLYLGYAFVVVGFLFAVGSRAGMAMAATLSVLSLFWFASPNRGLLAKSVALGLGVSVLAFFSIQLEFQRALEEDLRSVFFATTWRAIGDYWLIGSGLGTFVLIYPSYELAEHVVRRFANHVHNDYLELFLETGLFGLVVIGLFFALVLRHFSRSALAEAAFIAVVALCLHSLVDYPLRTVAVAVPFGYLCAVILSTRPFAVERPRQEPDVEVLAEGGSLPFPQKRAAGSVTHRIAKCCSLGTSLRNETGRQCVLPTPLAACRPSEPRPPDGMKPSDFDHGHLAILLATSQIAVSFELQRSPGKSCAHMKP